MTNVLTYEAPHDEEQCCQCHDYAPLVRALRRLEIPADIDPQTGGNVHVVVVDLIPTEGWRAERYLMANCEGASIYDDRLYPDDYDCEGQAHLDFPEDWFDANGDWKHVDRAAVAIRDFIRANPDYREG